MLLERRLLDLLDRPALLERRRRLDQPNRAPCATSPPPHDARLVLRVERDLLAPVGLEVAEEGALRAAEAEDTPSARRRRCSRRPSTRRRPCTSGARGRRSTCRCSTRSPAGAPSRSRAPRRGPSRASGRAPGRRSPRAPIVISGVTPVKSVGPTKWPFGSAAHLASRARRRRASPPRATPLSMYASTRSRCRALMTGPIVTPGSMPLPTLPSPAPRAAASRAPRTPCPTPMTTLSARHRCPAQPIALSTMFAMVFSQSQSSMTTPKFFAPPSACTRFPVAPQRCVDVLGHRRRPDEGDAGDVLVLDDAVHDVARAVDHVHDAGRQLISSMQLEEAVLREGHLLARLHDDRVPRGDRVRQKPERHHRREVVRRDDREDAHRLRAR